MKKKRADLYRKARRRKRLTGSGLAKPVPSKLANSLKALAQQFAARKGAR